MKLLNILLEMTDYEKYKEIDRYLKSRENSISDFAKKKYEDFYSKMFDKYGTAKDKSNRKEWLDSDKLRYRTEYFKSLEKIIKKFTSAEQAEEERVRKLLFGTSYRDNNSIPQLASKQYLRSLHTATSALKNKYGFRGDMNSKYAYHLTNADRLIDILHDDTMYTGENAGVSLSTFKDLIKRKPIFYHGEVDYTTIGVQIVFDLQKIKNDKFKIRPGSEDDIIGTVPGEEELSIRQEFTNVRKYIVKVIIFVNHIDMKLYETTISELKKYSIPYYLNKKVNFLE